MAPVSRLSFAKAPGPHHVEVGVGLRTSWMYCNTMKTETYNNTLLYPPCGPNGRYIEKIQVDTCDCLNNINPEIITYVRGYTKSPLLPLDNSYLLGVTIVALLFIYYSKKSTISVPNGNTLLNFSILFLILHFKSQTSPSTTT